MKRNIYLEGDLKNRFVDKIVADVSTLQEALKLIEANFPTFRSYLLEKADSKDTVYEILVNDESLEENEKALMPLEDGDIIITPVPAGASGVGKIIGAVFLTILAFTPLGALTIAGIQLSSVLFTVAANLALSGIQDLLAPDPAVDKAAPPAYLFNGSEQNIVEGDPVPILYGQLRIPGRPIGFSVVNSNGQSTSQNTTNSYLTSSGDVISFAEID